MFLRPVNRLDSTEDLISLYAWLDPASMQIDRVPAYTSLPIARLVGPFEVENSPSTYLYKCDAFPSLDNRLRLNPYSFQVKSFIFANIMPVLPVGMIIRQRVVFLASMIEELSYAGLLSSVVKDDYRLYLRRWAGAFLDGKPQESTNMISISQRINAKINSEAPDYHTDNSYSLTATDTVLASICAMKAISTSQYNPQFGWYFYDTFQAFITTVALASQVIQRVDIGYILHKMAEGASWLPTRN